MSWSLQAEGTKVGAVRQLDACKIYGTASAEEQAAFDKARAFLKDAIANGYECSNSGDANAPKAVTIFKAAASGHGTQITSVSLSYSIAFVS